MCVCVCVCEIISQVNFDYLSVISTGGSNMKNDIILYTEGWIYMGLSSSRLLLEFADLSNSNVVLRMCLVSLIAVAYYINRFL